MKGMQRIKRHKNFINVVKYVLKQGSHHKSDPVVIAGNMTGDCAKELIAEFDTASKLRKDIAKPAWHNSLRLPHGDKLTQEQWVKIADDYMNQMGFSDTHLRCYVLHDDPAGQHIHIIANRVDSLSGKIFLGRHESLISGRIISELEIVHGLTQTPTVRIQPKQTKRKLSRNEEMLSQRTGLPCPKKSLQQIIDKCLTDRPNLETFIKRIGEAQVSWTANVSKTGKINGFSFEYQNIAFKASQLGKMYSWANLQKLLNYEPELDSPLLLNARPVAPAPAPAPARIASYRQNETLSISEKIASLSSPRAMPLPVTASLAPALASKMAVEEDKRQRIISAVLNLQNSQRRRNATVARFNSWLIVINLLKKIGFSVLYPVRQFKNIFSVHSFPPPAGSKFTANLKQQR